MARTGTRSQAVARAFLPGAEVAFHDDGTATWTAAMTAECPWCGTCNDLVGESITLAPNEAWGLLQAVRRHLDSEGWREATRAIMAAMDGPEH